MNSMLAHSIRHFPSTVQVGADERLAAGDVGEVHLRQFLNGFDADFLFRLGRCFITVTHP